MPPLPDMLPVSSTTISHIGHDGPVVGTLYVRFRAKKGKPPPLWGYVGVPRELYEQMLKAPTAGNFFHSSIKPSYHAERLE